MRGEKASMLVILLPTQAHPFHSLGLRYLVLQRGTLTLAPPISQVIWGPNKTSGYMLCLEKNRWLYQEESFFRLVGPLHKCPQGWPQVPAEGPERV